MRNYPSFRQLSYFLSVAKTLSFGKAAEECFVTQSTLSAGIKELETLLGKDLFERSSRRVQLTRFGQSFIAEAERIVEQADHLLDFSAQKDGVSGQLKIGMIPTIAPFYGFDFFEDVTKEFPECDPVLVEDLSENLLRKLQEGIIDMAMIALPYDIRGFSSKVLFQDRFVLGLPQKHAFKNNVISIHQLQQIEMVMLEDGHCLSDHAVSSCGLAQKRRKTHSISSVSSMINMALHEGKGVPLTKMMLDSMMAIYPDLHLVRIEEEGVARDIALIWRKTSNYTDFARNLAKPS